MSAKVKIIIGSHGSGKSDWVYNHFLDISRNNEDKTKIDLNKKLYLVVPEQDTNDKQRLLMKKSYDKGFGAGILNIDVVSFDRIAHNVFDLLNIEPEEENIVEDDVKTMIITLILSRLSKGDKLKYCGKMAKRIGFAKKMTQVVSEFYAYEVSDEDIDAVLKDKKSDIYKARLEDFRLIFNEFKRVLSELKFSIKEDKYDLLNKRIEDVNIFNDSIVAFDGFTGFTPIQLNIFKKIANVAKEVYVTIDHRNPEEVLKLTRDSKIDDIDFFYLSKKFVIDIMKTLDVKKIQDIISDDNIKRTVVKWDDNNAIKYLEKHLYDKRKNCADINIESIKCYEADSINDEVSNVIQLILNLTRNEGYKYNDIRIVVPKIEEYRDQIIKQFNKYNIPLFIDDSEGILNSPYIEAVRAALDVVNYNFSYESVMRYINSGIIEKNRSIYVFNNYLLEHAIRGYDRYKYIRDTFDINEDIKEDIKTVFDKYIDPLMSLYKNIQKTDNRSIENYLRSINYFIKESRLDETFTKIVEDVDRLKENDLSFNRISAIMAYSKDVLVKTIKNLETLETYKNKETKTYDEIDVEEFKRMLDVGLVGKALKSIPYSLDQVVVGDLMRSRFDNPRIEFFLGLNQSSIPSRNVDTNLIDDGIRELFTKNVKELSQTTIETILNQRFYIYLTLTNPLDKLILSYTKVNSAGDSDEKSPVLNMILDLFKKKADSEKSELDIIHVNTDKFKFYKYEDLISYVALNIQDIKKFSKVKDGKYVYNFDEESTKRIIKAKKVLRFLKANENFASEHGYIFSQKDFFKDTRLEKSLNDKLININEKKFEVSATKIESFNKCPFKYFMEDTLRLRKNRIYAIESFDIGNLAHKAFEKLFKDSSIVKEDDNTINKIIDKDIKEVISKYDVFNEFDKANKNFIGVNKLEYIKSKTYDLIFKSAKTLIDIAKESNLKADKVEHKITYNINEDDDKLGELGVTGKVDRIDVYSKDDKVYVEVIDYKSGMKEKEIDAKEIENGTNIQLTLYIDYCLNHEYKRNNKKAIFAGAFYFWVANPLKRNDEYLNEDELIEGTDDLAKLKGLRNSDDDILKILYKDISRIKGKSIDDSELTELITTMHNKVNITSKEIDNGVITARPYKNAYCTNCSYINVCKRDQLLIEDETVEDTE